MADIADIIQDLERELRGAPLRKQKKIIHEVYRQIVPGRKSKRMEPGKYRDFAERGPGDVLGLVSYVENQLRKYNMETRAERLYQHYFGKEGELSKDQPYRFNS